MLCCEGYKMFRGEALITPNNRMIEPFKVEGTWLYKPEYDCWYCGGRSFSASIVRIECDYDDIEVNL